MLSCKKCELFKTRKNVVPGVGNTNADIMLVGECPGPDEDKAGIPFIGRAGKLLREVLDSLGVETNKLFITNIVKCFPYYSLNPKPTHVEVCSPYLLEQVEQIDPKLIVSLGRYSSEFFIGGQIKITKLSGKLIDYKTRKLLPILHPSYVLRGNMKIEHYALHFLPLLGFYNE